MFASRWHSPPKLGSVLICVTGTCSAAIRSASTCPSRRPRARRRARPEGSPTTRSSTVVLPAPGLPIRFTTVTPSRSKSARFARAIVPLASSTSSSTFTCVRCMPPPSFDLDRLDLELLAPDRRDVAPAHAGHQNGGSWSSHSCPQAAQRSTAGTTSSSSRAPSQTDSRATIPKQNSSESGTTWRRRPTRTRTVVTGAPARMPLHRRDDRARDRELVHQRRAAVRRSSRRRARRPARPRPRRPARARSRLLDLGRLAGDDDHLAGPAVHRLDEAQHGLRIHVVRIDQVAVLDPGLDRLGVGLHHVERPGLSALLTDVDENESVVAAHHLVREIEAAGPEVGNGHPGGWSRSCSRSRPRRRSRRPEPDVADGGDEDLLRNRRDISRPSPRARRRRRGVRGLPRLPLLGHDVGRSRPDPRSG